MKKQISEENLNPFKMSLINILIYLDEIELLQIFLKFIMLNNLVPTFSKDFFGNNPFQIAISNKNQEILQILVNFTSNYLSLHFPFNYYSEIIIDDSIFNQLVGLNLMNLTKLLDSLVIEVSLENNYPKISKNFEKIKTSSFKSIFPSREKIILSKLIELPHETLEFKFPIKISFLAIPNVLNPKSKFLDNLSKLKSKFLFWFNFFLIFQVKIFF